MLQDATKLEFYSQKLDASLFAFGNHSKKRQDYLESSLFFPVLRIRIRIRQIRMFLGLLDPDPLVRGMDPNPSIIKQK
jgi:hypothetical protein